MKTTPEIYLATGNSHKADEIAQSLSLSGLNIAVRSADAVGGMPDVEESATTFEENARLKAEILRPLVPSNAWVLADDSGLEVDALCGRPGVRSARYAGPHATPAENNRKLLGALMVCSSGNRRARFTSVFVLLGPGVDEVFRGEVPGRIAEKGRGEHDFGYDPLFVPQGYTETFAEMEAELKNRISHRGVAVAKLAAWIRQHLGKMEGQERVRSA